MILLPPPRMKEAYARVCPNASFHISHSSPMRMLACDYACASGLYAGPCSCPCGISSCVPYVIYAAIQVVDWCILYLVQNRQYIHDSLQPAAATINICRGSLNVVQGCISLNYLYY